MGTERQWDSVRMGFATILDMDHRGQIPAPVGTMEEWDDEVPAMEALRRWHRMEAMLA